MLDTPICNTDSQVALHWICRKNKVWKQFVQNWVEEIRHLTEVDNWRHCTSEDNPADIPSCGARCDKLKLNPLWLNGPIWLGEREEISVHELHLPDECLTELKKGAMESTHGMLTVGGTTGISQVIDVTKYNNLYRLLRVTSYVLRFIKILTRSVYESIIQELINSETEWVKEAQTVLSLNENFQMWKRQF